MPTPRYSAVALTCAKRGRGGALAVKATQLLGLIEIDRGDDLAELARELHDALGPDSAAWVGAVAEEFRGSEGAW